MKSDLIDRVYTQTTKGSKTEYGSIQGKECYDYRISNTVNSLLKIKLYKKNMAFAPVWTAPERNARIDVESPPGRNNHISQKT